MSKLRILIEEMVDKKLKELSLNEAFKSKKMQALSKVKSYTSRNNGGRYRGSSERPVNLSVALSLFNLRASDITDDQIDLTSASEAKSLMKQYPKGLAFIVSKDNILVAVYRNGKPMGLDTDTVSYRYQYETPDPSQDSKRVVNSKDKYNKAHAYHWGKGKDNKTGMSSEYQLSVDEIFGEPGNMCYFIKVPDNAKGTWNLQTSDDSTYGQSYNVDYYNTLKRNYETLNDKQSELKRKLIDLRSSRRKNEVPPKIVDLYTSIEEQGAIMRIVFDKIVTNLGKLDSYDIRYSDSNLMLKHYIMATLSTNAALKEFQSGKDPSYEFNEAIGNLNALKLTISKAKKILVNAKIEV